MKYINSKYSNLLASNNLLDFSAILNNKSIPWFEEPNIGRNGLSGVKKLKISDSQREFNVFIKIQQNYYLNNKLSKFLPFIKKTLVAKREYNNIKKLSKNKIPTCEILYFKDYKSQALLITKELTDYYDLKSVLYNLKDNLFPEEDVLKKIAKSLALEIARLHKTKYSHNCLYPKHIFINSDFNIAFIDFEKCKKTIFGKYNILRDLECLFYHVSKILNNSNCCIDISTNFKLKKIYIYFMRIYIQNYYNINNKKQIKNKIACLFDKIYKRSINKRNKYLQHNL
tara:strand:+ start:16522 stop:17373 length:852 start_codon:yes stop_codon:yes gene_type:complete